MKTLYKIFIAVFIVSLLFVFKDDLKPVVDSISTYLDKNNYNQAFKLAKEQEEKLSGRIDIPGALRVANDVLKTDDAWELSKNNIIVLTNKYRKENGDLIVLTENEKLNLSADKKLKDMFANQYFEHISPDGVGVGDLAEEVEYQYLLIGENLALGDFDNDLDLVDAWMASPGHRANILNEHYKEIGVAVARGNFEGKNVWLAVQHFGTPEDVCPRIDEMLYGVIDLNENKIKEIESDLLLRKEAIDKKAPKEGSNYYQQINEFNNLVENYNKLINETKEKINNYNDQVHQFNLCLLENE